MTNLILEKGLTPQNEWFLYATTSQLCVFRMVSYLFVSEPEKKKSYFNRKDPKKLMYANDVKEFK